MSGDRDLYVGTDPAGFDLFLTDHGFRWGEVDVTRIASIDGRGVVLSVSCDAGEVLITVTPAGQSMHVECRQTHPVRSTVMQTVQRWRARGRGRGRAGWLAAFDDVTPAQQDQPDPDQEQPR